MISFYMNVTTEYDELINLYRKNGLEYSDEDVARIKEHAVTGIKLTMKNGMLIGGTILGKYEDKYLIDGISVDKVLRHNGLGKILVNKLISKVQELGGGTIYLSAKIPEFYEKLGFTECDRTELPKKFDCYNCKEYNVTCKAKVMKRSV